MQTLRTEIELNQIIAMLSSDIVDRIYMDMLSVPCEDTTDIAPVSPVSRLDVIA